MRRCRVVHVENSAAYREGTATVIEERLMLTGWKAVRSCAVEFKIKYDGACEYGARFAGTSTTVDEEVHQAITHRRELKAALERDRMWCTAPADPPVAIVRRTSVLARWWTAIRSWFRAEVWT